jgi:hypothetical protein
MGTSGSAWLYLTLGAMVLLIIVLPGSGAEKDRWLAVAGHWTPALLLIYRWSLSMRRLEKMRNQMHQHLMKIDNCLDRIAKAVE